jgi:hypothetical protein
MTGSKVPAGIRSAVRADRRPGSLANVEPSRLARRVLFAFVLTFVLSRAVVLLIMARKIPLMFLYVRGNHVHHLNYGILLLTATGGYLLFAKPGPVAMRRAALVYGVALALTFDEFGMWLHLGGSYWQRVSVDAVVVIAGFLGLLALAPSLEKMRPRHRWALLALVVAIGAFGAVLAVAGKEIGKIEGPRLRELEMSSTP